MTTIKLCSCSTMQQFRCDCSQEADFQITFPAGLKALYCIPEGQLSASACSRTRVSCGLLSILLVVSVQQLRLHPFEGLLLFICGISSDPLLQAILLNQFTD